MSGSAWSFNWNVKVYLSSILILRLYYIVIVKALGIFCPPGEFHLGAIESNFYAEAGLFIRFISGASKSKVPREQFGRSREIKGKVFIMADLFTMPLHGNFLSVSDVCTTVGNVGSMAIVVTSGRLKWKPRPR